jgi:hypothetical protein
MRPMAKRVGRSSAFASGLLYAPGNVDARTSSLRLLLSDRVLRQQIDQRAREWARIVYAPNRVGEATWACMAS